MTRRENYALDIRNTLIYIVKSSKMKYYLLLPAEPKKEWVLPDFSLGSLGLIKIRKLDSTRKEYYYSKRDTETFSC